MKNTINNTFKSGLILSTAVLTGVLAIAAAFTQAPAVASASVPSVTIVAQRMTAEQKLAYDAAQEGTQIVLISAKRLTAEQKLAMDKEDQFERQQLAEKIATGQDVQG